MEKKPTLHAVDRDGDRLVERVDAWRGRQATFPGRAPAIRELMRRALQVEERKLTKDSA
jgi:hypothetical protein